MIELIDWTSKGLTFLLLLLAALFVVWKCFEGLAKITTIGAEFRHFIVNRTRFDVWLAEMRKQEARERGHNGLPFCRCETPKEVVPDGHPRLSGWCGNCGGDLAPASQGSK